MRFCRFNDNRLGLVEGASVRDVTAALDVLPAARYPYPTHDAFIAHLDAVAARAKALAPSALTLALDAVTLLSPVANPGKIVAAPVNYEKHLAEVKADASLHQNTASHTHDHPQGRRLPQGHELARRDRAKASCCGSRIAAPTTKWSWRSSSAAPPAACRAPRPCATSRAMPSASTSRSAAPRTRASASRPTPTACSARGWSRPTRLPSPGALDLELRVNGERRQHANTRHMTLGVAELVEMASSFYTLHPGDVVFTGTPEGVSPIEPGDEIEATIQGIGTMRVAVRADGAAEVAAAGLGLQREGALS